MKCSKPFFLYLAYSAPHIYLTPRADKLSKYLRKYDQFDGKYNPNYGAMIESLDDGVGRIMEALAAHGLLDNTLVIFSNQMGRPTGAVRVGDYKLIEFYEHGGPALYNLREDISESSDLSAKLPEKTRQLQRLLADWRRQVGAQMPLPNPGYK